MPIRTLMKYVLPVKELSEINLETILYDIRNSLSKIDGLYKNMPLLVFLNSIESEDYFTIKTNNLFDIEIDLREVQRYIQNYKYNSENGCRSCKDMRKVDVAPDEKFIYCGRYEKRIALNPDGGYSKKIMKHMEKGCEKLNPKLKPISEFIF